VEWFERHLVGGEVHVNEAPPAAEILHLSRPPAEPS
jgi:hypothetical protein